MTVVGETATASQPTAIRVDLRLEIEPSMFQGTVEAIDLSDSSMLIRTDYGRMLRLFSMNCQGLRGLNEGDRVRLEPDPEGALTVTTMDRTVPHLTQSQTLLDQTAWSPGLCDGETL